MQLCRATQVLGFPSNVPHLTLVDPLAQLNLGHYFLTQCLLIPVQYRIRLQPHVRRLYSTGFHSLLEHIGFLRLTIHVSKSSSNIPIQDRAWPLGPCA